MEKPNYFMHRINGGKNAFEISHKLLESGYLSIGWSDFSSQQFVQDVMKNGISAIDEKYQLEHWALSRNRWCLWRFLKEMQSGDYVLVPGFPNWENISIYKIVDNTIYSNDNMPNDIKSLGDEREKEQADLGFYRKVEVVKRGVLRADIGEKLYRRLKIQQTNTSIKDLELEINDILNDKITLSAQKEQAFDISTAVYCIYSESNNLNSKQSLLKDNFRYIIPIYQRAYSWNETEINRLLDDLFRGYWGEKTEDGLEHTICMEPMFVGTMQLTNELPDKSIDVVDGQQRISTIFVLLKYLKLKYNIELPFRNFDWLETRVANEQTKLEQFASLTTIEECKDMLQKTVDNKYIQNFNVIDRYFTSLFTDVEVEFDVACFVKYILNSIYFVVVQTQASLSQTIKIFNTINTAGLDLNTGDLFKLQMAEYLQYKKNIPQEQAFEEVDKLYQKIDANNRVFNKEYTILTALKNYQYFLIAHHKFPKVLYKYSVEKFYDNLFDAMQGRNIEHFTEAKNSKIIELSEIDEFIDIQYKWDDHISKEQNIQKVFNLKIISKTRYSQYRNLAYLMLFIFKDQFDKVDELFEKLSRLFIMYSLVYAKAINEVHTLIYDIRQWIVVGNIEQITKAIEEKINLFKTQQDLVIKKLEEPIAILPTPVNKNLLCWIVEYFNCNNSHSGEDLVRLFNIKYDIEHIHATANEQECQGIDKNLQNSIGNLMLLEYDINRSIQDDTFENKKDKTKKKNYTQSDFRTVNLICSCDKWDKQQIEKRKEDLVSKLYEYLVKGIIPSAENFSASDSVWDS
jgi:uncharacterized protein with ParB-like and HNH nuclease domain